MAGREEKKERRRRERVERERREARAASRRRRLQYAFGALLAVGALLGAGLVISQVAGGGGGDPAAVASAESLPRLPPPRESDLARAAERAGCEVVDARLEGDGHDSRAFEPSDYDTNPPTSGDHAPDWYEDGVYAPGAVPELGRLVHTLEHGRINVQYRPGTPARVVRSLEAFLAERSNGHHMLLYENTTGMEYAVAATAWTHLLGCPEYNDRVPDAMRAFATRHIDQGPERDP